MNKTLFLINTLGLYRHEIKHYLEDGYYVYEVKIKVISDFDDNKAVFIVVEEKDSILVNAVERALEKVDKIDYYRVLEDEELTSHTVGGTDLKCAEDIKAAFNTEKITVWNRVMCDGTFLLDFPLRFRGVLEVGKLQVGETVYDAPTRIYIPPVQSCRILVPITLSGVLYCAKG